MNIILVPYRNRKEHLNEFIKNVCVLFFKYLGDFKIVVVEQMNEKEFNRAKLLNVGFLETNGEYYFHHDVDIIPNEETVQKLYTNLDYDIVRIYNAHNSSLGGIVKFKKDAFTKINGLPNYIWGWGIEDRVFYYRSIINKLKVSNNFSDKKNFVFLPHKSNQIAFTGIKKRISDYEDYVFNSMKEDDQKTHISSSGLNNIKYQIVCKKQINRFTDLIQINI